MHLSFVFILALGLQDAHTLPKLLTSEKFDVRLVSEAINYYVNHGEAKFLQDVENLAILDPHENHLRQNPPFGVKDTGVDVNERIGWTCRLLYETKIGHPLRSPDFGTICLPEYTMPLEQWPLFPLAKAGDAYFVLGNVRSAKRKPESVSNYINYCRNAGKFRRDCLPIPTADEAEKELAILHKSPIWKAIKWKDSGPGLSYNYSEIAVIMFLESQTGKAND